MPTRRQRRRWAAQGGRPRDHRRWAKQDATDRHPFTLTLGDVVYRADSLEALGEALEGDGGGLVMEGDTLHLKCRPTQAPVITVSTAPDPRVLEVHHDNRAKRRARGER